MDSIGLFLCAIVGALIGVDIVLLMRMFQLKRNNFRLDSLVTVIRPSPEKKREKDGGELWVELKNG